MKGIINPVINIDNIFVLKKSNLNLEIEIPAVKSSENAYI